MKNWLMMGTTLDTEQCQGKIVMFRQVIRYYLNYTCAYVDTKKTLQVKRSLQV